MKTLILLALLSTGCTSTQRLFIWSKSGEAVDKEAYDREWQRLEDQEQEQNLLDKPVVPELE